MTNESITTVQSKKTMSELEKATFLNIKNKYPAKLFNHFRASYTKFLVELSEAGYDINDDSLIRDFMQMYEVRLKLLRDDFNNN